MPHSTTMDNRTNDAACESKSESTLYPKISGKLPDLLDSIAKYNSLHAEAIPNRKAIPFTGTVKLHGTHADILVHPNGEVVCQSRNRTVLTPEKDNFDFAAFCSSRQPQIQAVADKVRRRWKERCPQQGTLPEGVEGPVILAGEYIGTLIQPNVAISQLSRRFVICSIHISGVWQPIEAYADIAEPEAEIHNISAGGFYHLDLSLSDGGAGFLSKAEEMTAQVAESCPFGKAMGAEGKGEGIVWTPAENSGLPNEADFWLKTKGEDFRITSRTKVVPKDGDLNARAAAFARETCTPPRLEQGWDYLAEMGIEQSVQKGLGTFLSWIVKDIEEEEKRDIKELQLKTAWKGEVSRIAKPWFEWRVLRLREAGVREVQINDDKRYPNLKT